MTSGATGRTRQTTARRSTASIHAHEAIGLHVRIASCNNMLMQEARTRVTRRWNMTLPQFDVLAELARAGDRGFTSVELSRQLLVTSGNLTGIFNRLEARGLIRREPDPKDRRVVRVRLSARGEALTRRMLPRHADDFGEILGFMPAEKLARLSALLDEVRHGLAARRLA